MTSKAFELAQLGDAVSVDGSGNVGVGTSSPVAGSKMTIADAAYGGLQFQSAGSDCGYIGVNTNKLYVGAGSEVIFQTGNAQAVDGTARARIDSSGNLLVGKSSSTGETAGCELREGGRGIFTKSGSNPLQVRRLSDNGKIVVFYKDTTQVGSIGIHSTGFFIDGESGHTGLRFGGNTFIPRDNQADADNVVDLGAASARFDDVHATNGTIQTSDINEKQDIASLTNAEITAAKAISKLFKTFKWKDKVASKGDAARTHTGVIAQEVETAMSDAGLDAGNYAFFISNTWWETSTEVAAVEADEENGIEAQEAHTRIDTYDTSDKAPEGATERNRKGIRYPELLSFIGAATEQRLTNIEIRLDALEAE